MRRHDRAASRRDTRSRAADERGWRGLSPCPRSAIGRFVGAFPVAVDVWESLHQHDLRMPWLGRPFIGLTNFAEMIATCASGVRSRTRCVRGCHGRTRAGRRSRARARLNRALRARGMHPHRHAPSMGHPDGRRGAGLAFHVREPTASSTSPCGRCRRHGAAWFSDRAGAWMPIVLADVWKTTPFVAMLLLAGLQAIDPTFTRPPRRRRGPWRRRRKSRCRCWPAITVAVVFRSLDAFRVFDLIYVMTRGGPGTATETLSLYISGVLPNLRFGYGAALAVLVFLVGVRCSRGRHRSLGATTREAR